jgi:hypothetical protein
MARSGLIGSRSESTADAHVGRPKVARNLKARSQSTNSAPAENALSRTDDGGKIIRLYPRAVDFRENPALPGENREYNVISFPHVASVKSTRQRAGKPAKPTPEIVTDRNRRGDEDYHYRMLENVLAAGVLVVVVISGDWIFSTLATIP